MAQPKLQFNSLIQKKAQKSDSSTFILTNHHPIGTGRELAFRAFSGWVSTKLNAKPTFRSGEIYIPIKIGLTKNESIQMKWVS